MRRVEWFESRRNPFFALVSAPFLVVTQLAFAIERWRAHHGAAAAGWLEALGELEALASLATYAFEHPDQPFPEIVPDERGAAVRRGQRVPPAAAARPRGWATTSAWTPSTRLWLVTGSNMSGKSTLLRTVGASTVLALAGAPVPRHAPAAVAPAGGRQPAHGGLAAGRGVALLRGDQAPARAWWRWPRAAR